jgi:hypothetical protein
LTIVLFKLLIALADCLLGAWVLRRSVTDLPEDAFVRRAVGLQLVPALLVFAALYVFGHQEPTSDVPGYYVPAARSVLAGQIPFRDFTLSYAPLFAYVGAALVFFWNGGKVFALFALLLNTATLLLWHSTAKTFFDRATTRQCTILFATSGHVLMQGLLGTNQTWIGTALAASALLIARDRGVAAGLVQAAAACTTKVLAHLFWPVLWLFSRRRAGLLLGAAVPTMLVYGVFVLLGAGPGLLYPLRVESGLISSGNIPYLLDLALGGSGPAERSIVDTLTLLALGVTMGWLFMRARAAGPQNRPMSLPAGLALTGLVLMLFSKKSFTGYIVFVMYPIVLMLLSDRREPRPRVGFLIVFNALLVVEPSLWFHLKGAAAGSLRGWFAAGGGVIAAGFVCLDLALLACYVYLAWLSVRWLQSTADGAIVERNASQSATACSLVKRASPS